MKSTLILVFLSINSLFLSAQDSLTGGQLSLGTRSTMSLFDADGWGLGTGGQFRIQLSSRVNTEWFADYISINDQDKIRSEYYHIGWSVLFYPMKIKNNLQPYFLAGHCFDYNKKTVLTSNASLDRWGSAVQGGLGTHLHLSNRFDFSITCQYMIHLTAEIESIIDINSISIVKSSNSTFEGHLLCTLSLNYKLFHLWGK